MGETLNLSFHACDDNSYEVRIWESWSGNTTSGKFVPPYTARRLNALQKKLENMGSSDQELSDIGYRLYMALCGADASTASTASISAHKEAREQSVQSVLRDIIQRTLKRRGTVALALVFGPGCDEFVRYPWELLHNGNHFLIISGIFTLSRSLQRPDAPVGCGLPVQPPLRVLYIGSSPSNCPPLETERSFEAMEQGLAPLIDAGQVFLDRLEPPTFSHLVRYFNLYGGVGLLDDSDTSVPCYVIHFDGHGVYGRLCPKDGCETMNKPDARRCQECGIALGRVNPQTYLCFCDENGLNSFVDAQTLRRLLVSSDIRLAVFSACQTAMVTTSQTAQPRLRTTLDATLATALVTGQVPAVVAMPFSLQDDLSPTFMYHFYESLANGRMLEEALSRARQAMLSTHQKSWFIPVLYRLVAEGEEEPVALITSADAADEHLHPLAHLAPPSAFVGRVNELRDLDVLLAAAASGQQRSDVPGRLHLRADCRRIALTGYAGIGKSALAYEAIRRNRKKFAGGIIGISLHGGKPFSDALLEMIHHLRCSARNIGATDVKYRTRMVQSTMRSLASRGLPCLLLLDGFEEVKDYAEIETWLQFLCTLPQEAVVIVTSRSNPEHMVVGAKAHCRWYEYPVKKMTDVDLLRLFAELAAASGLDQRIQLENARQQEILHEICTLLDGYPLGAELIFGTARTIDGQVYTPEAATRSLEEVCDELRKTPLAGIRAVLDISHRHLSPSARLLLSYLAAFKLPFNREQISMLIVPEMLAVAPETLASSREIAQLVKRAVASEEAATLELAKQWRIARDELVKASFLQFDGNLYSIHSQTRNFALSQLSFEERRRIHRVVAAYYYSLPRPNAEEWFEAFEHLEAAAGSQDLQEAVRVAIRAAHALEGGNYALELQGILRRASGYALHLGDTVNEAEIQHQLAIILTFNGIVR